MWAAWCCSAAWPMPYSSWPGCMAWRWREQCQHHLVQPAGLRRTLAGVLVRPAAGVAAAGRPDRDHDVGAVRPDGAACHHRILKEIRMYRPKYHALTDIAEMQAHIDQHSLGAWVCTGAGELIANHIPFVLEREDGQLGRLTGHVSRANPVWRQLADGAPSVVMFMGPQAYITPAWYTGKQAHGKVVPTWNYVTV